MERVVIVSCDMIMNGKAHGVKLADGRDCTAWNDKVEAGILMQHLGQEIDLEIKQYMSKSGKSGFNIVGIGNSNQQNYQAPPVQYNQGNQTSQVSQGVQNSGAVQQGVQVPPTPTAPVSNQYLYPTPKDTSITSQCMLKCVTKLMCPMLREKSSLKEVKSLGEGLLKIVYELYGDGVDLLEGKHE